MNLVVESISITMEKELAGGVSVPVVLISMGSQDRKALSMELKNWSSEASYIHTFVGPVLMMRW